MDLQPLEKPFSGVSDGAGIALSIIGIGFLALSNMAIFADAYWQGGLTQFFVISLIVSNLSGVLIIFIPSLQAWLEGRFKGSLEQFIDLPVKSVIKFPHLSTFLSEQAFVAFLGSLIAYSTRQAHDSLEMILPTLFATGIAAIVGFLVHLTAITFMTISIVRFSFRLANGKGNRSKFLNVFYLILVVCVSMYAYDAGMHMGTGGQ